MSISSIIKQVESAQNNLESQANIFINEDKKKILDYVRLDQLFELGEDGNNRKLEPYTPFTRAVKISEGRDPNVVTLFDEGDFYRSEDLRYSNGVLDIFFTDSKTPKLIDKYGADIAKLNKENETKTNEQLEIDLVTWVLESVKI
jgi:hypothetical protein